jgi:hypothetical protein
MHGALNVGKKITNCIVEQILPNNNEKCYSNFSPTLSQLNTAKENIEHGRG